MKGAQEHHHLRSNVKLASHLLAAAFDPIRSEQRNLNEGEDEQQYAYDIQMSWRNNKAKQENEEDERRRRRKTRNEESQMRRERWCATGKWESWNFGLHCGSFVLDRLDFLARFVFVLFCFVLFCFYFCCFILSLFWFVSVVKIICFKVGCKKEKKEREKKKKEREKKKMVSQSVV